MVNPELSPPPGLREACGVFGVVATEDVAGSIMAGLYALQHRGQESAGIATLQADDLRVVKGMGLVPQVFGEGSLSPLSGPAGIGHVRYGTSGASDPRNTQPLILSSNAGPFAIAHNGNLTNTRHLRALLGPRGEHLRPDSDSELLGLLLATEPTRSPPSPDTSPWLPRIERMAALAQGAYSLLILTPDGIFATRDSLGLRPLYLGRIGPCGGPLVVASESCAFPPIGADLLREVLPGEIVHLSADGLRAYGPRPSSSPSAFCAFEYVYFARPDSLLEGQRVHAVRQRFGRALGHQSPADADRVIGVPDSALPAALGYAEATGIPYSEGLLKSGYLGRTFLEPTPALRERSVLRKYTALRANLEGQRVVLVDDSIVRGTTIAPIIKLVRDAGALEVHVRVSSPPITHPCYMGVDMPRQAELLGAHRTTTAMAADIGADSLAFLSHAALLQNMRSHLPDRGLFPAAGATPSRPRGHCTACFSGAYPLELYDVDRD